MRRTLGFDLAAKFWRAQIKFRGIWILADLEMSAKTHVTTTVACELWSRHTTYQMHAPAMRSPYTPVIRVYSTGIDDTRPTSASRARLHRLQKIAVHGGEPCIRCMA